MNIVAMVIYTVALILCLVCNVLQAAAIKSGEECREIDNRLISAQRDLMEKQREYIGVLEGEQENGGWIPCSERLPEKEYEAVLVWLSSNGYDIAVWCEEYGFRPWYAIYFDECTPEWKHGVIAWQPLPEPYKAGEQE